MALPNPANIRRSRLSVPKTPDTGSARVRRPTTWPTNQIEPFLSYLALECGLANNTITAYRRDLHHFAAFCAEVRLAAPDDATALHLHQYTKYLFDTGLSTASIARYLAALRMFFRFHLLNQTVKRDVCAVLESPKTWRRVPHVLNQQHTLTLLSGIDPDNPLHLRDEALLELLYATGMRASEAASLPLDGIDFQVGFLRCIGKGNKERIIPVHKLALSRVQAYLQELRPRLMAQRPPCPYLFVSRTGRALDRIAVWRIVRQAARRAGMTGKISPHTLRHSFGSHLLQGGADLRVVQELLGHADVTTTQIYTHVDQSHLRAVHKKYHPRP